MIQTRNPTIAEAVEIVMRCLTSECRHACIAHWRRLIGAEFADRVEVEAKAKFKKEYTK